MTVSTRVDIYGDIGLYPDYKRTMLFDSVKEQNEWFNSQTPKLTLTDVAYNKIQNTFKVEKPVGEVYEYVYVRISNLDSTERYYYGFVSNVAVVDEDITQLTIQLDPIQTFMTEWQIGESLVVREHCDRWGAGENPIRISPTLENITCYNTTSIKENIDFDFGVVVIAATTNDRYYDVRTYSKVEQENASRVQYFVIPVSINIPTRGIYGAFTFAKDNSTLTTLAVQYPRFQECIDGSVASRMGINPDSVIGIWIIPEISDEYIHTSNLSDSSGVTRSCINIFNEIATERILIDGVSVYVYSDDTGRLVKKLDTDITSNDRMVGIFNAENLRLLFLGGYEYSYQYDAPSKPSAFPGIRPIEECPASEVYEPALYFEPYRTRGICTESGTELIEVPDNIYAEANGNINLVVKYDITTLGANNLLYVMPEGETGTPENLQKYGNMGASTVDISVACDNLSSDWLTYTLTQRDSDRKMMYTKMATGTISNMFGGVESGAIMGTSGYNRLPFKLDSSQLRTAMGFGLASAAVTSVMQGINMWQAQETKEQTLKNQPSTLNIMGSGFNRVFNNGKNYWFYERVADDVAMEQGYHNFRYYGYKVNKIETPNIKSRYYFNYICTANTTIEGSLNADIKQSIVDILEKGITFFHYPHCRTTEYPNYENVERAIVG